MIKRFVNKHRKQVIRLEFLLFMPIFVLRNLVFNTDCKKVKRPRFRTQIVCSKLLTLPAYCLKLNCERMTNRCFCCYQGRSQKFAKGGQNRGSGGRKSPSGVQGKDCRMCMVEKPIKLAVAMVIRRVVNIAAELFLRRSPSSSSS